MNQVLFCPHNVGRQELAVTTWKDKAAPAAERNRQEIVNAKLSEREIMRLGLLTAGGSLIVKAGLSSRAFGQPTAASLVDPNTTLSHMPASPPIRPFIQRMPRLRLKKPIKSCRMTTGLPDPITAKVLLLPCDGTIPIDGATKRIKHRHYKHNPNVEDAHIDKFGVTKFHELEMKEAHIKLHFDYETTKISCFGGQVPGPPFRAKYGEPALLRFKNHLPSVRIPQAFGIAEMTTHLHNGHTPSESDGNPVNSFNSVNDLNAVNPLGLKDQHYPNVKAGYNQRGDPTKALGSLWYLDHHLYFTAQNVYKTMFGCYTLFDELDTGDGTGVRLPHDDFDVPIMFNDFLFDQDYQTVFGLFNPDGILGDRFASNGAIQPKLDVEKRRYWFLTMDLTQHSFRIDNGASTALAAFLTIAMTAVSQKTAGHQLAAIRFNSDGSATEGRIDLTDGQLRTRVGVDWMTGRISVPQAP